MTAPRAPQGEHTPVHGAVAIPYGTGESFESEADVLRAVNSHATLVETNAALVAALECCQDALQQYAAYSEQMRAHGRGLGGWAKYGNSNAVPIEQAADIARAALARASGEPAVAEKGE